MNAYYDARAPWHDEYLNYTTNEAKERLLRPIINDIENLLPDKDVLEIACGTGNWTQVLSKRAKSVLATDVNQSMIDIAGKKEFIGNNVNFKVISAYDISQIESNYDIIFMADWFSHIPKSAIDKFIEDIGSLLKPDGYLIIIDMIPHKDDLIDAYTDVDGNCIGKRTLPDGTKFEVIKNLPSENDLREYFSGLFNNIIYRLYQDLRRWMLICKK